MYIPNKDIADCYARALYGAAVDSGQDIEEVEKSLAALCVVLDKGGFDAMRFFSSPIVKYEDKKDMALKIFNGHVLDVAVDTFLLMIRNNRVPVVSSVLACYRHILALAKNENEVNIVSAHPLDDDVLVGLTATMSKICGQPVRVTCEVVPAIMGGFILEFCSLTLDMSYRNTLNKAGKCLDNVLSDVDFLGNLSN